MTNRSSNLSRSGQNVVKLAYKVPEVVQMTGRSENFVYDALASGALTGSQSHRGATWFVLQRSLDAWVLAGCPRRR